MMKDYFTRLFEHDGWANRRVCRLVSEQAPENERACKLLSHLLGAEHVWITRLRDQDSTALPIWPDLSIDECVELQERNEAFFNQFLNGLTGEGFDREYVYKNSKGMEFRTPLKDILTHLALHGTHHRGQILAALRDAGVETVSLDFITFVREIP